VNWNPKKDLTQGMRYLRRAMQPISRPWGHRQKRRRSSSSRTPTKIDTPKFEPLPQEGCISVLIPAYRTPKLTREAAWSSLRQDLPSRWDVEVLIGVDACSETLGAACSIAREDDRVRVVGFQPNVGPYQVLNGLHRYARGDAYAILDSDDRMTDNRLRSQIQALQRADFSAGLYETLKQGRRVAGRSCPPSIHWNTIGWPIHSSWMVKRSVFEYLGGYQPWRCGADSDFFVRVLATRATVRVVQDVVVQRNVRPEQLTARGSPTGPGSGIRREAERKVQSAIRRYRSGHPPERLNFPCSASARVIEP